MTADNTKQLSGLALSLSIYKQVEQEAGRYPFDEEDAEDFINLPDGDLL